MVGVQKKFFTCEPANPHRCQAMANGEQCQFLSVKGMAESGLGNLDPDVDYSTATNCPKHGSNGQIMSQAKKSAWNYRLEQWQTRIKEFSESDASKSLKEEIGILRLLVESIMEQCTDRTELIMYSGKLSALVMNIEKLVISSDKLDIRLGSTLDRTAAMAMAQEIVQIISRHIDDDEVIDTISAGIIQAIATANNEDHLEQSLIEM